MIAAVLNLLAMGGGEGSEVVSPLVTITLLGSYIAVVSLTGSYESSVTLTGSSVPIVQLLGSV